ncbi:hypothetical protein GNZ11_12780 [Paraburkholderia xenovorans]|nr:hypothetical protein [Paraburkholderia xenovorans]
MCLPPRQSGGGSHAQRARWNGLRRLAAAATNLVSDIQSVRAQGRKVILSIGGAQQNVTFDNRTRSQAFVDSMAGIYAQLGGVDGIDWDNYELSDTPNVTEMTWIGQQLKARYPGFIISSASASASASAPAPWIQTDLALCSGLECCAKMDFRRANEADRQSLRNAVKRRSKAAINSKIPNCYRRSIRTHRYR